MRPIERKTLAIAGLLSLCTTIALGGYYVGFRAGEKETKNIQIEHVSNAGTPGNVSADFGVFWEAWDKLKKNYINGDDIKEQDLVYGAIRGITESLDDPNTVFFTPEDSEKFNQDISGSFSGIGAEIGIKDGKLIVIAPLKKSPAERAGLKPGDEIAEIDGKSTAGMTVDEAVKLIRGELGTKVILTILHDGVNSAKKVEIARGNIEIPTVEWEMLDGGIIHVKLFSFSANTPAAFYRAMLESLIRGGNGMILDMRGNPGGYLDVAVHLAGWFLEEGDVVAVEKFTSGIEKEFTASGNEALREFPVVVLVDEGSASASEILAGALRIKRNIKIVGQKTFGKGTVQELQPLSDGSTLKITIANWLLPNRMLIEGNGLQPDYVVSISEDDIKNGRDPQLEKAIEIIRSL